MHVTASKASNYHLLYTCKDKSFLYVCAYVYVNGIIQAA